MSTTSPKARYVFGQQEYNYGNAENTKMENPIYMDSVLPVIEAVAARS
ncbi:hypothetical protein GA0061098_10961 [Bradyrhizobium shewense]|uniref:Uncharacterized protein n=1 Tax=Bradyrhizobium shewense TaxID=1761772 RepID=A0A1C3XVU0_9BRAD|nr:hypothetical protein GA0061098_10961 [Bradyrhizobium shewense]